MIVDSDLPVEDADVAHLAPRDRSFRAHRGVRLETRKAHVLELTVAAHVRGAG